MKMTVQMKKIQEQLRPGVITRDGFLGKDRRNLVDILEEDEAKVKRMKLTHRQIADRMLELRDAGMRGLGDFFMIPPVLRSSSFAGHASFFFHTWSKNAISLRISQFS